MFDDLKTHEWWFLGLAAAAGFLLVRHIIDKFTGEQPVAGSSSGPGAGSRSTGSGGFNQSADQQHDQFKRSSDDFSGKSATGEQSDWFRRGKEGTGAGHGAQDADTDPGSSAAQAPPPRPWYQVLEVSSVASPEEVKRAYQRKIRQYHPDRVAGLGPEFTDIANARAKEINLAYEQGCAARGWSR